MSLQQTIYKILIVDDQEENRRIIARILEQNQYEYIEAKNGREALDKAISEKPDLIILDVMMPELDGYDVCRRLREIEETEFIPIIFLSAHNSEEDRVRGLVAGGDDFLSKPFSMRELLARINSHLHRAMSYLDANPSTKLPGGSSLNKRIQECIANNVEFAVGYADLDNFKAYNDSHGFLFGDKVIKYTGRVVSNAISEYWRDNKLAYTGHIGGDDFIYLCEPDVAESIAAKIVTTFTDGRAEFHTPDELDRGSYLSKDRQGNPAEFPLLSISVAVIMRKVTHIGELSHIAAEMKHLVKARGGSTYVVDTHVREEEEEESWVLLGEGERVRAKQIKSEFEESGYRVVLAHNGPDLIKEAFRLMPLAVVIGRTLPMIDPYLVDDFMSRLEEINHIPRISFTAVPSDESSIKKAVKQAVYILPKPNQNKE